MKRIFESCLTVFLIASCSGHNKEPNQYASKHSDTIEPKIYNKATVALIKRFRPIIRGIWVRTDYVNSLKKSFSPYSSRGKLRGVACMNLDLPNNGTDNAQIGYSLNNHEGAGFILYLKPGLLHNTLKCGLVDYETKGNFYELGYLLAHKDTSVILYHLDKKNRILDSLLYTKVADKDNEEADAAWGIQYITNKILISCTYSLQDSLANKKSISFDNAGSCSNFLDFKTYSINTDFEAGPANNMDNIYFDVSTKSQKSYLYKIQSDTLFFYDENYNADSTKLILGKLKYKLVRQK